MTGGPRIRHLDDFQWQDVRRQQHGKRMVSVREKLLDFSPRFLSLYARQDPGMIVQAHGHNSDHVLFDHGDTFGPFVAEPEGVTLFEVMGDPGSFPADIEGYERLLGEAGVRQLPNLPDWLEDTGPSPPDDRPRQHQLSSSSSSRDIRERKGRAGDNPPGPFALAFRAPASPGSNE